MVKRYKCAQCRFFAKDRNTCIMTGLEVLPYECSCYWFSPKPKKKKDDLDNEKGE